MGVGLPCRVDVASCASVVGTRGEIVVDYRRCGLEFADGQERALYFQTRRDLLPLILFTPAACALRRLHQPMQANGSLHPGATLAQPTSRPIQML